MQTRRIDARCWRQTASEQMDRGDGWDWKVKVKVGAETKAGVVI